MMRNILRRAPGLRAGKGSRAATMTKNLPMRHASLSATIERHRYGPQSILPSFLSRAAELGRSRPLAPAIRQFHTESEFHSVADETLEDIQDAVEMALEDLGTVDDFEVTYASGVLTMVLPPHGTWVINKQTPNQQLWWSSPLTGPRRYEYDADAQSWVFTRQDDGENTLTGSLREEMKEIYDVDVDV